MFRFKLDPLLNFRRKQEEEKQRDLAFATREFMKVDSELEEFTKQKMQAAASLNEKERQSEDVNVLRLYEDFIKGRDYDIVNKKAEVQNARDTVSKRQEELLEYVKKRRSLEAYRERREAAFREEETRKERIFMDEVAGMNWFREAL
ncbi:MAG: flagellar export protein FliJ [Nitrospinota bacterium]